MAMTAPTEWWRTFFSGTMAEWWLGAMTAEQTRLEADFVQQTLQVAPPARLLDVPCGGGRHSLSLAAQGYRMTGVDISPAFLAAARSNPSAGAVTWEQRDMRDLPWPDTFDGAFSLGNSFAYYDDEGNRDFLHAVARVLKPGARFVLDTGYVAEALLPALQERGWYESGGILVLSDRRYDPAEGRLHVEYTAVRDGKAEKWPMSARIYTYRELCRLFEDAGFAGPQGYGSLAREPFQLGSRRLLMVATKKVA
jgi:SAM-dependent methyltransferase